MNIGNVYSTLTLKQWIGVLLNENFELNSSFIYIHNSECAIKSEVDT